jgi:RNA polymerase sigma factor (sigma-70 family)
MPPTVPESLRALLVADEATRTEASWAVFVREHSELLLRTARSLGGDHDAVMDRYTFVLDALRREDCSRLRGYAPDGRSSFSTWLVVVAHRLCLDQYRQRYGRPQSASAPAAERHRERRQLADLIGDAFAVDLLEAATDSAPDTKLENEDRTLRVGQAVAELEPEDRLILRLRFEEELSVPEISRLLRLGSPFSLYRRIDRILENLRGRLRRLGIVARDV